MKKILTYPNKKLRVKTLEIKLVDKKLLANVKELVEILEKGKNAVGLAATQIGLQGRFFGIKDLKKEKAVIFINPKIEKVYGKKVFSKLIRENPTAAETKASEDFLEGCLSFPNYFGTVKRYLKLDVSWQEIKKDKLVTKKKEINGFEAIVWQHESDHLEGIVFVGRVKEDGGKFFKVVEEKMIVWSVDKVINGEL